MAHLLHISASPQGERSASLRIAKAFLEEYSATHPGDTVETWDLWDGTLPPFGPAAVAGRTQIFYGATPTGEQGAAWQAALDAFARFDAADKIVFSVPMWNHSLPYILKQFIDVITQPGTIFGLDPAVGYQHLLEGRGKKAAVIYTSGVWGPHVPPNFGNDFQSPYFTDWLRFTGIDDITDIHHHPTLSGDAETVLADSQATARKIAAAF